MKDPREVILSPVVSEKSYTSLDRGVYTFIVHPNSTKPEIRDAIQKIFDVHVAQVNTLWRKGKRKRTRYTWGQRSPEKRAVVTLVAGESIEIFNPK